MKRTRRGVLLAVPFLLPAVWVVTRLRVPWQGTNELAQPATTFSLEELCRDEFDDGWHVLHQPDLPGPYTRRLPGMLYYHPTGGQFVVRLREPNGTIVWEERTRPGVSYRTLELVTADGCRAHGLLVQYD